MTDQDPVAALRAALDAGPTPGPWLASNGVGGRLYVTSGGSGLRATGIANAFLEVDAAFAAAGRDGVPALFARIAELEGALEPLRDARREVERLQAGPAHGRDLWRSWLKGHAADLWDAARPTDEEADRGCIEEGRRQEREAIRDMIDGYWSTGRDRHDVGAYGRGQVLAILDQRDRDAREPR